MDPQVVGASATIDDADEETPEGGEAGEKVGDDLDTQALINCDPVDKGETSVGGGGVGRMTLLEAVSNLITCQVGAGILSIPRMVADCGWICGVGAALLAALVSLRASYTIARVMDVASEVHGSRLLNMGEAVGVCFGPQAKAAVVALICFFQLAGNGAYFVLIGQNLHFLADALAYRDGALIGALICMRLAFLRDISVIARWSIIGVIAAACYVLAIVVGGMRAATTLSLEERLWDIWPAHVGRLPTAFAIFLFAFSCCDVLPVLQRDMAAPNEIFLALRYSHATVASIYVLAGGVGYFGWGRHVGSNVLESMREFSDGQGAVAALELAPQGEKWFSGYLLSAAVVSNLTVTIPVLFYTTFRSLESEFVLLQTSTQVNSFVRVAGVLGSVAIAIWMPFFLEVVAVISTGLLVFILVFVPVAVAYALHRRDAMSVGSGEVFLVAVGFITFVIGLSHSLQDLAAAVQKSL